MSILYIILGGFFRRWFGGAFKSGIMSKRSLQTAFMIGLFMSIYITNNTWQCWSISLIISAWLQFQFWSRGHGCCFDIGRGNTSPDTLRRYNEQWYHIPCDWLFKALKISDYKYGFLYDFIYMTLRYTFPIIPLMIFNWKFVFIGLSIAPIYAFCWTLYEKEPWLRPKQEWLNSPTKWAEIISGAIVYGGCCWIW